jgi:hypothetical protein
MDCQRCGSEIVRRRRGPEGWICDRCYQLDYRRRRAVARQMAQLEALVEIVAVTAGNLGRDAVLASIECAAPSETERKRLLNSLEAEPDALKAGSAHVPRVVGRLTAELFAAGAEAVVRPACPRCERTVELLHPTPEGRICPLLPAGACDRVRALRELPAHHHPHPRGSSDVQLVPQPRSVSLGAVCALQQESPGQRAHPRRRRPLQLLLPPAPGALRRVRQARHHRLAQRRPAPVHTLLPPPPASVRAMWTPPTGRAASQRRTPRPLSGVPLGGGAGVRPMRRGGPVTRGPVGRTRLPALHRHRPAGRGNHRPEWEHPRTSERPPGRLRVGGAAEESLRLARPEPRRCGAS